jgi:hypothetical protein
VAANDEGESADLRRPYPSVGAQPRYPALEEEVLDFWRSAGIFERSVERNPPS